MWRLLFSLASAHGDTWCHRAGRTVETELRASSGGAGLEPIELARRNAPSELRFRYDNSGGSRPPWFRVVRRALRDAEVTYALDDLRAVEHVVGDPHCPVPEYTRIPIVQGFHLGGGLVTFTIRADLIVDRTASVEMMPANHLDGPPWLVSSGYDAAALDALVKSRCASCSVLRMRTYFRPYHVSLELDCVDGEGHVQQAYLHARLVSRW